MNLKDYVCTVFAVYTAAASGIPVEVSSDEVAGFLDIFSADSSSIYRIGYRYNQNIKGAFNASVWILGKFIVTPWADGSIEVDLL